MVNDICAIGVQTVILRMVKNVNYNAFRQGEKKMYAVQANGKFLKFYVKACAEIFAVIYNSEVVEII